MGEAAETGDARQAGKMGGAYTAKANSLRSQRGPGLQEQAMRLLEFPPLLLHVALLFIIGWLISQWNLNLPFFFVIGFLYLCFIESRQRTKIEMRIRSEERKSSDRKRLLSDAETARWLNNVVESVWPIFLNKFVSEHLLMRLAPWFLAKFKPWTAKNLTLQQFYFGSNPPVFSHFRAGRNPTDGDHLVLEMRMNLSAAEDMSATLAVQLRKRLGLGIWTTFKVSDLQIEGDVRVGIRFVSGWPVIKRLRVCFSEAPVIRMVAKPIFSHGVDVTDLPGIAAWLDKMVIDAMESSLVEPNMLVIDVEQLVSDLVPMKSTSPSEKCSAAGDWFHMGQENDVATLVVEILEAKMLKPCDPNGKADPYVKIAFGQQVRTTTIKRKTLTPVWHEPFRIPIQSWVPQNPLVLKVLDKDRFVDDKMGYMDIFLDDNLKDGKRHDMWCVLKGVKTGQLRVAVTIEESTKKHDESENGSTSRLSVKNPSAIASVTTDSRAETQMSAQSEDESLQADLEETPFENEYENVDIGVGPSGCIAIVNPGRDVVNEGYSAERLHQRRNSSRKYPSHSLGETDRQSSKSGKRGDQMDSSGPDLGNPDSVPEVKHHRISNMLGRRSREKKKDGEESGEPVLASSKVPELTTDLKGSELIVDPAAPSSSGKSSRMGSFLGRRIGSQKKSTSAGEISREREMEETTELVLQGPKGTEVHTELKISGEDVDRLDSRNSDGGSRSPSDEDDHDKHHRLKKMGLGVLKQAHHIGHGLRK